MDESNDLITDLAGNQIKDNELLSEVNSRAKSNSFFAALLSSGLVMGTLSGIIVSLTALCVRWPPLFMTHKNPEKKETINVSGLSTLFVLCLGSVLFVSNFFISDGGSDDKAV